MGYVPSVSRGSLKSSGSGGRKKAVSECSKILIDVSRKVIRLVDNTACQLFRLPLLNHKSLVVSSFQYLFRKLGSHLSLDFGITSTCAPVFLLKHHNSVSILHNNQPTTPHTQQEALLSQAKHQDILLPSQNITPYLHGLM